MGLKCFRAVSRDVKAFSLLEMLIVSSIFTVVMGVTYGMLMTGSNVQSANMVQSDMEDHARRVVKMIADEIQMAIRTSLNPFPPTMASPGIDSLSFQVSEGFDQVTGLIIPSDTITIQFVLPDRIERTVAGNPQATFLTRWVSYDSATLESGLSFHCEGEDIIIILDLTRQDNKGRNLEAFAFARVRMRNSTS